MLPAEQETRLYAREAQTEQLEVAYRVIGSAWKRTRLTQAGIDRLHARLAARHGEGAFEIMLQEVR